MSVPVRRNKPAHPDDRLGRLYLPRAPVRVALILGTVGLFVWLAVAAGSQPGVSAQGQPTLPPRPTLVPTVPPRPTLEPTLPPRPTLEPTRPPEPKRPPPETEPTPQPTPMVLPVSGSLGYGNSMPLLMLGLGALIASASLAWRRRDARHR